MKIIRNAIRSRPHHLTTAMPATSSRNFGVKVWVKGWTPCLELVLWMKLWTVTLEHLCWNQTKYSVSGEYDAAAGENQYKIARIMLPRFYLTLPPTSTCVLRDSSVKLEISGTVTGTVLVLIFVFCICNLLTSLCL